MIRSTDSINAAWAWAVALAIILVVTVGPALFASEPDKKPEPDKSETKRSKPKGGRRTRKRKSGEGVIDFADAFRARQGRTPSGSEIRAEFPDLPKSTAHDYAARSKRT